MAFVDAIELASDAGAADAIGAMAGDLARVAPAIENTEAGSTNAIRGVAATRSPSELGTSGLTATIPAYLQPFSSPITNILMIGGLIVGGIYLSDRGVNAITVLMLMIGAVILIYTITKSKKPTIKPAAA